VEWWSGLWLNEGFASFVEWTGIRAYDPNWDESAQMVLDAQSTALALDSSQYSHPIVQAVADPSEIDSLFDMISYDKGCSILMMLADILGANDGRSNFKDGLHNYLTQHAYGNANSDDLWSALQAAAPSTLEVTVPTFMHKYTQQLGYPLVTLAPDASGDSVTLTQSRFIELPYDYQDPTLRDTQNQYKWSVQRQSGANVRLNQTYLLTPGFLFRLLCCCCRDLSITYGDSDRSAMKTIWFKSTDTSVSIPTTNQAFIYVSCGVVVASSRFCVHPACD
jgi:aminopeptidase N